MNYILRGVGVVILIVFVVFGNPFMFFEGRNQRLNMLNNIEHPTPDVVDFFNKHKSYFDGATNLRKEQVVEFIVDNYIEYKSDYANYGTREYWATPSQTLASHSGDCEDSASLKAALMRLAGINTAMVYMTSNHAFTATSVPVSRKGDGIRDLNAIPENISISIKEVKTDWLDSILESLSEYSSSQIFLFFMLVWVLVYTKIDWLNIQFMALIYGVLLLHEYTAVSTFKFYIYEQRKYMGLACIALACFPWRNFYGIYKAIKSSKKSIL